MQKSLYENYFKGKKVTVMGLGLLGRGVGDTAFLYENGAILTVTDKKTNEDLKSSLELLSRYNGITYVLGEHRMEDFEDKDFILKAAGVPYDSPHISHAKDQNIPVYMSAALVSSIAMKELEGVTIIGITGTRGKSTTTGLIAHILKDNGLRVHVGGNVRGVANLPLLDEIEEGDYLVLELDSWQLQGFGDLKISPHIAVFTSFLDDHMNYYKDDKELYFRDKANIYRNQTEDDVLLASPQASVEIKKRDPKKEVVIPDVKDLNMRLIGSHNMIAASLAYEVGAQCGLSDEELRQSIATFHAVEGRLEDLGMIRGIRVFNDNNGTTGDATVAALQAITETYNTKPILIMGGADKGLPLTELEKAIGTDTKEVIYLSGTGTDRISLAKTYEYEKMEDCIAKAFEVSSPGDIILYSPAFASFSKYFNNEYEKNDTFLQIIETYR